jgi:NAD(P)H-flavin reductase/ferredoxin
MASVAFEGGDWPLEPGETVLAGLKRQGHVLPSSCESGVCQSCMMKLESGTASGRSVAGLSAPQKAAGYFLPCVCVPEEDLAVSAVESGLRVPGVVDSIERLSERVRLLRVRPETDFGFMPGQFVNLILPDGTLRSYSIAGLPEGTLDFHVALMPGGAFSTWLEERAQPGDRLEIQGPLGTCFYTDDAADQPLLLAGTGTGLAPLYGIVRDAIRQGHRGAIHLYHGCLDQAGLYLVEELRALAADHGTMCYTPCVLRGPSPAGVTEGNLEELVLGALPSLKGFRVYLCGHPDFVKSMQRKTFMAGASLGAIFADAFLPSKAAPLPAKL